MLAIKAENISKQYRLGTIGSGTLTHDFQRWVMKSLGKEDPFLKIGDINDRTTVGNSDYVWALNNINFEVNQGDVLGIIGKNGAGKSTLLKLLSKVTSPTTGSIKTKGRIASLLEVGTGFHPELTGMENIYLNGAILGMSKAEIKSKLDEIIAFSGVEKYIDTPVKRYSSGMYVRLAFAVAAHLEPEILVIDEVLAVGDLEFQKKCLGKMKDVSQQGRTVLFVSHNMNSISSLCNKCIYLSNGTIKSVGNTNDIINEYLTSEIEGQVNKSWDTNFPGDEVAVLHSTRIINSDLETVNHCYLNQKVGIEIIIEVLKEGYKPIPNIHLNTLKNEHAFTAAKSLDNAFSIPGNYKIISWIPENLLNAKMYTVDIGFSSMNPVQIHFLEKETLTLNVLEKINDREEGHTQKIEGVLRPKLNWDITKI